MGLILDSSVAIAAEHPYHFPHYRLASGRMAVFDAPGPATEAWMNGTYKTFRESGWDHTAWTRRRIVHMSESRVHVDTQFTRYRKDGSIMGSFESLYILTKEDGRWGIKFRSSFETPDSMNPARYNRRLQMTEAGPSTRP